MRSTQNSKNDVDELIPILKFQLIPCWERFGSDRLAVTAATLKKFCAQSLPKLMQTSVKKRIGKKVTSPSRRVFNNSSSFRASWPEDNQAIFRYPTLVFILEGQADFHVADYVIHCPQYHFLLFSADVPRPIGRPHLVADHPGRQKCSVLWFFDPPGTNGVVAYVCHSEGEKHWSDGYRIVQRYEVFQLYKVVLQEIKEAGEFVDISFQAFLRFFLRELQQGRLHRAGGLSSSDSLKSITSPIEEAQQYIKNHLDRSLTTAHVAGQVYMSRNNFLRCWSREMPQTFHEFVTEQRMEEAGRLLQDGYWSILQICRFTGLKPTQFRIQFKRHFGMSPSAFHHVHKKRG